MTRLRSGGIDIPDLEVRCHPYRIDISRTERWLMFMIIGKIHDWIKWRTMQSMAERVTCDVCGRIVPKHAHYVARIDVFADPDMPQLSGEELAEMDFDSAFAQLIEQMKSMTADELQDQVHRRFEFRLCPECQRKFLANPLGMPREKRSTQN